ncbi:hypothetical protein [Brevibacillus choshinensis]|uniref:hypothetical protein n=1 Tax=Brevibacillus choshinensis TaxID=54911 RepID=UPI002E1FAEC7|nr:hypothetical protein [Brevibacillus choshinensis]MED4783630.1 hypothetical protein [Brevibacillus choshinensis]
MSSIRADRGNFMTAFFVCQWCGYSEEMEDFLEGNSASAITCSCCGLHEWESIEHR